MARPPLAFTPQPVATGVRYVPPSLGATIEAGRPSPSPGASPSPVAAPSPVVPPPTGQIAYRTVQTIFDARCTGCHGNSGGLRLEGNAAARLVGVASRERPELSLVNPGNPDLSWLWQKVSQDRPAQGQRMPRNGDPLLPDELATIRVWIAQGAKTP